VDYFLVLQCLGDGSSMTSGTFPVYYPMAGLVLCTERFERTVAHTVRLKRFYSEEHVISRFFRTVYSTAVILPFS